MILIDDRAGSKDLVSHSPLDELGTLCRLDSADVAFPGNGPGGAITVGVEVKSIFDLISSADTGRLQATQLPAMQRDYDAIYLLYYGLYRPHPNNHSLQLYRRGKWVNHSLGKRAVPYGYVESFLLTLESTGLHTKRTGSIEEAAQWLGCLYRWWSKPWSKHRGLHTFDNSRNLAMPEVSPELRIRARVAAQLPGVGYEKAMAAARHFATVSEMVNASADDWQEVPGIGKVLAKSIRRSLI